MPLGYLYDRYLGRKASFHPRNLYRVDGYANSIDIISAIAFMHNAIKTDNDTSTHVQP